MSTYEDYTAVSGDYDAIRVPVGVDVVLGAFAAAGPLERLTVLDAGCGTGAYARAIAGHVARVEAVDLNEGMLDVARAKFTGDDVDRVRFHQASVESLPLPDASVDAAMVNQMLHHLPDEPGAGWVRIRAAVAELARVLRPGGALTINACDPVQVRRGWWYAALVPKAVERMCAKLAPTETLAEIAADSGFESIHRYVALDVLLQGEGYHDARGPLDARWRRSDSLWAMVEAAELDACLERVRRLDAAGALDAFVAEHDQDRVSVGQTTFLVARRR